MSRDDKRKTDRDMPEATAEIESLLCRIEAEQMPERLLVLAQELQAALNGRRRKLALRPQH